MYLFDSWKQRDSFKKCVERIWSSDKMYSFKSKGMQTKAVKYVGVFDSQFIFGLWVWLWEIYPLNINWILNIKLHKTQQFLTNKR